MTMLTCFCGMVGRRMAQAGGVAGAAAAIAAVTLLAGQASAQDALGGGRALDANLDPGTGGFNSALPNVDYNSGNLVITNNVLGGRGFRGNVGYAAADDFRGVAGSDDLYRFRADSGWSSVNFVNYGDTYQQLRFGQEAGLLEYRRQGTAATLRSVDDSLYRPSAVIEQRLRIDQLTSASSIASVSKSAIEPKIIGGYADEDGNLLSVHTSSLRGLMTTPLEQMTQILGLSSYDRARLGDDYRAGVGTDPSDIGLRFDSHYADLRIGGAAEPEEPDTKSPFLIDTSVADRRFEPQRLGDYDRVRERIAERYARLEKPAKDEEEAAPTKRTLTSLDDELQELRDRLAGDVGWAREAAAAGEEDLRTRWDSTLGTTRERPGASRTGDEQTPPATPGQSADDRGGKPQDEGAEEDPMRARSIESFGVILRHGERIERLTSEDQSRFEELLAAAESALREGRYFWAERRFNRALRFTPGHPLATVGLAHTQIGAGLYLSASLTLRSLFVFQPEMIDARFDPGLVPNRPRLIDAASTLETRLEAGQNVESSAFLLAYIGRLLDDREMIEHGLTALAGVETEDELVPLLRSVWLGGGGDKGTRGEGD